jgi:MFS-type transporter involved in bile tolerance (Atg22 family)
MNRWKCAGKQTAERISLRNGEENGKEINKVALAGPVLGTMADTKGFKKPIFTAAILVCMGIYRKLCAVYCLSGACAWQRKNRNQHGNGNGSRFLIIAVWWLVMSLPLLKGYEQKFYVKKQKHAVKESFCRLGQTFGNIRKEKHIFMFLLAFFFYIDGVYTIIDMATAYGAALGLDSTGLLLALLVTQLVAFPCAILFGKLSGRMETCRLITVCIFAYLGIAIFAVFLKSQVQFWILAVLVGMFQGGIQALSRSYFTKIIPAEKSGEYFGLMDICGKGASFMGTTIVSLVSQITGNINAGVGMIAVLFVAGIILFRKSVSLCNTEKGEEVYPAPEMPQRSSI